MKTVSNLVATFFYCGYSPVMPGTVGTTGAAIVYALLLYLGWANFFILIGIVLLSSALNIWIGPWAEEHFGTKDPQQVVIDEVAGYFLTVCFFQPSWTILFAGFFAFRLFDITKPYPIKKFEFLSSGVGILVDDLLAAVYAALSIYLLHYLMISLDFSIRFPLIF